MRFCYHNPSKSEQEVISVDGIAPKGPNLSHWPGNRTPTPLKHDLSTGMALKLARLSEDEKIDFCRGLDEITNTHYDTDGVLSAHTLLEPDFALKHEEQYLDAARTGDFQVFTTDHALACDLVLAHLADENSPHTQEYRSLGEVEKKQRQYEIAFDLVPRLMEDPWSLLDGAREEYERVLSDLSFAKDGGVALSRHEELDLAIIRSDRPLHRIVVNTVAGDLFRVLATVPHGSGHLFRFHYRVESWFELVNVKPPPRKPLESLATFLSALEASESEPEWSCHPIDVPMPECWFGEPGQGRTFGPVAPGELCVSRLTPLLVTEAVLDYLKKGA